MKRFLLLAFLVLDFKSEVMIKAIIHANPQEFSINEGGPTLRVRLRTKRSVSPGRLLKMDLKVRHQHFSLRLVPNTALVTTGAFVEWHFANGSKEVSRLGRTKVDQQVNNGPPLESTCLFVGKVLSRPNGSQLSRPAEIQGIAAIDACGRGYRGYIQIGHEGYLVHPLKEDHQVEFHALEPLLLRPSSPAHDMLSKIKYENIGLNPEILEWDKEDYNIDYVWFPQKEPKRFQRNIHQTRDRTNMKSSLHSPLAFTNISDQTSREQRLFNQEPTLLDDFPPTEFMVRDSVLMNQDKVRGHHRRTIRQDRETGGANNNVEQWEQSGYYIDDVWSPQRQRNSILLKSRHSEDPANAKGLEGASLKLIEKGSINSQGVTCKEGLCEYTWPHQEEPRWLEMAVAIDDSVISFHGAGSVKRYVLTLLNIVSAIYRDPTLGSNLKFVILRLIFFEGHLSSDVLTTTSGNQGKQMLEDVNEWNEKLWSSLPASERHDVALWLTRKAIGGPSGYAPVFGVCDPARSCSLNRDEGLSSAFVIAHELGHILGLSHDGDTNMGNDCKDEASQGSVMAPLVGATFSYFHWSKCSAREFQDKSKDWQCTKNHPHSTLGTGGQAAAATSASSMAYLIGDMIQFSYSLDDQCRMEFGLGFAYCQSFQLNDPCVHLWCSHVDTPDICKTKKGPPMDGTECGQDRWCVNGYCEPMSKRRASKDGLRHNPRPGGWSEWGSWGECSRTCGGGVTFRSRSCDGPKASNGGSPCSGEAEEFSLCNIDPCDRLSDFRAEQCRHYQDVTSMTNNKDMGLNTKEPTFSVWLPYEPRKLSQRCFLNCWSPDTQKRLDTGGLIAIDGTPCSYGDHPSGICVQGSCVQLGCDKIQGSPATEDRCGVCEGNNSTCKEYTKSFARVTTKAGLSKVMVLPAGARNINLWIFSSQVNIVFKERITGTTLQIDSTRGLDDGGPPDQGLVASSIVLSGTMIESLRPPESKEGHFVQHIRAKGPLLEPLAVLAGSNGGVSSDFQVMVNFSLSKVTTEDPLLTPATPLYHWVSKGWTKCSKDCGGGQQRRIFRCIERLSGKKVGKAKCGPASGKPPIRKRRCNTFTCAFTWKTRDWEHCSATCGHDGLQTRQVFCVHMDQEPQSGGHPSRHYRMADPRKCRKAGGVGGAKPESSRPCNRVPCRSYWVEDGWTDCSETCGPGGVQRLMYRCPPPKPQDPFYECGPEPQEVLRPCLEGQPECPPMVVNCTDESPICEDDVMKRFCVIPSYAAMCCQTCNI